MMWNCWLVIFAFSLFLVLGFGRGFHVYRGVRVLGASNAMSCYDLLSL